VSKLDKKQSLLYKKFGSENKFVLAHTQKSFWIERQEYTMIVFDGKKWRVTKWSYELNKKGQPKKQKSKSFKLESSRVSAFFDFIKHNEFFSFNQDSLNWNKKENGQESMLVQQIMDGTTEEFEIISASGYRISFAHEPEQRQDFVNIRQRKKFMECLEKFLLLVDKKSQ
jgi:hypothetical protein